MGDKVGGVLIQPNVYVLMYVQYPLLRLLELIILLQKTNSV